MALISLKPAPNTPNTLKPNQGHPWKPEGHPGSFDPSCSSGLLSWPHRGQWQWPGNDSSLSCRRRPVMSPSRTHAAPFPLCDSSSYSYHNLVFQILRNFHWRELKTIATFKRNPRMDSRKLGSPVLGLALIEKARFHAPKSSIKIPHIRVMLDLESGINDLVWVRIEEWTAMLMLIASNRLEINILIGMSIGTPIVSAKIRILQPIDILPPIRPARLDLVKLCSRVACKRPHLGERGELAMRVL